MVVVIAAYTAKISGLERIRGYSN